MMARQNTPPVASSQPLSSALTPTPTHATASRPPTRNQILGKILSKGSCITHRTGKKPMDVVVSCSTGHQVSDRPGNARVADYFKAREQKLKDQAAGKKHDIFKRVTIWVDGYTGGLTDLEIKNLVAKHGGKISHHPSASVTHICTSASLSGSKTHQLLTKSKGAKPFVIDPLWVLKSVEARKRLPEKEFVLLSGTETQPSLFATGRSLSSTSISASSSRMPHPRSNEVIVLSDDDS